MKRYFIITGTHKGLGRSIAQKACEDARHHVIGISRAHSISASNYLACSVDLSDLEAVHAFEFEDYADASSITLIHNAGRIGDIKPMKNLDLQVSEDVIKINYLSSFILTSKFIKKYQDLNISNKAVVQISSGAATNPYGSWSAYCSSKAAIEMMSRCINEEQSNEPYPIFSFSIAPGVIDTDMQKEIRESEHHNFSMKDKFVELFNTNRLYSPDLVAEKILEVAMNPSQYQETVFRISLE